jgi:hypothetical protein
MGNFEGKEFDYDVCYSCPELLAVDLYLTFFWYYSK